VGEDWSPEAPQALPGAQEGGLDVTIDSYQHMGATYPGTPKMWDNRR